MDRLQETTLALLPNDLRDSCTARVRFVWFQVHFHSPKVHYEVWLTRKTERIEIGLHFEGPQEFMQSLREADILTRPSSLLYVQALKFLQTRATPSSARRARKARRLKRLKRAHGSGGRR